MSTMNMPGFTAEASLYNVNERYQATADAPHYGVVVQPAINYSEIADKFYGGSLGALLGDPQLRCWRFGCTWVVKPPYPPTCIWGLQWVC
jgi:hypothetical protein